MKTLIFIASSKFLLCLGCVNHHRASENELISHDNSNPVEISAIYVVRPDGDRPEQAEYKKLKLRLQNPQILSKMEDSAFLFDELTDLNPLLVNRYAPMCLTTDNFSSYNNCA